MRKIKNTDDFLRALVKARELKTFTLEELGFDNIEHYVKRLAKFMIGDSYLVYPPHVGSCFQEYFIAFHTTINPFTESHHRNLLIKELFKHSKGVANKRISVKVKFMQRLGISFFVENESNNDFKDANEFEIVQAFLWRVLDFERANRVPDISKPQKSADVILNFKNYIELTSSLKVLNKRNPSYQMNSFGSFLGKKVSTEDREKLFNYIIENLALEKIEKLIFNFSQSSYPFWKRFGRELTSIKRNES